MHVTQLSVFLENKPGHLARILEILSEQGINIVTLMIADTSDFGVIRMLTSDSDKAAQVLRDYQFTCSLTDVLALEVDDSPGALYKVLNTVLDAGLNIEYMYTFNEKRRDKVVMIFRFDQIEPAGRVLEATGYSVVHRSDIFGD